MAADRCATEQARPARPNAGPPLDNRRLRMLETFRPVVAVSESADAGYAVHRRGSRLRPTGQLWRALFALPENASLRGVDFSRGRLQQLGSPPLTLAAAGALERLAPRDQAGGGVMF